MTRSMRLPVALAAVLGASLVAGATWWRTHPEPLESGVYGFRSERLEVGTTMYVSLYTHHPREAPRTIRIHDIRPRILSETDNWSIDYLTCRGDIGVLTEEHAGEHCRDRRPVVGRDVTFSSTSPDDPAVLVAALTSDAPGRLRVDDWRIEFSDGWQKGSATASVHVTLPYRAAG